MYPAGLFLNLKPELDQRNDRHAWCVDGAEGDTPAPSRQRPISHSFGTRPIYARNKSPADARGALDEGSAPSFRDLSLGKWSAFPPLLGSRFAARAHDA